LPEFGEFQESLRSSLAEPPVQQPVTVVGSYRLFG
jgi:hypothetical protein